MAGGNPTLYGYVEDVNWELDVFGLGCQPKNKKTFYNATSRREAFRQAKRDAGIPMNMQPNEVRYRQLSDGYGNPVIRNGSPVRTREYHYTSRDGKSIAIQEHSLGHAKAVRNRGLEPHFNTRSVTFDGIVKDTGNFPVTHGHYNF